MPESVVATPPLDNMNEVVVDTTVNSSMDTSLDLDTDAELIALANEYTGIIFEWGSYKGTSHEVIAKCPWARQAGAVVLRSIFEAEKSKQSEESEVKDEENKEADEETANETGQKAEAEKSEQKSSNPERIGQKAIEQEAGDIKQPVKLTAGQEATTPTPARTASTDETLDGAKPDIPQAREAVLQAIEVFSAQSTEPSATVAPQEVKADIFSIPEISKDIAEATSRTTETPSLERIEPAKIAQETYTLSFPELVVAKEPPLIDAEQPQEPLDITPSSEIEEAVFVIKQNSEVALFKDEEYILPMDEIAAENIDEFQLSIEEQPIEDWPEIEQNDIFSFPDPKTSNFYPTEYLGDSRAIEVDLDAPLAEVEQTILKVAEHIEALQNDETEAVYEILDEITTKVEEAQVLRTTEAKVEPEVSEAKLEEAEDELSQLFVNLLDHLQISYTPELVDAFVKLALAGEITQLISQAEPDEKARLSQDRGTHEVINQLLASINSLKKSIVHAYNIGKSALRLYSLQFMPA